MRRLFLDAALRQGAGHTPAPRVPTEAERAAVARLETLHRATAPTTRRAEVFWVAAEATRSVGMEAAMLFVLGQALLCGQGALRSVGTNNAVAEVYHVLSADLTAPLRFLDWQYPVTERDLLGGEVLNLRAEGELAEEAVREGVLPAPLNLIHGRVRVPPETSESEGGDEAGAIPPCRARYQNALAGSNEASDVGRCHVRDDATPRSLHTVDVIHWGSDDDDARVHLLGRL